MSRAVTVVDHPLVRHKLSLMRRKDAAAADFRRLLREVGVLLAYEATRDLPLGGVRIETPIAAMDAPVLDGEPPCAISILRAGMGLLDGFLDLVPTAPVGHIGLYRDPASLVAVEYYYKVPGALGRRRVIVLDPMLATGNSAVAAVHRLKGDGATDLKFVCLVAAPEGVATFHESHPGVPLFTAALDERLNDHSYIVPGIGDAGDRLYGTR